MVWAHHVELEGDHVCGEVPQEEVVHLDFERRREVPLRCVPWEERCRLGLVVEEVHHNKGGCAWYSDAGFE